MSRLVGADVGGTFTDIVIVEDGRVTSRKVPTSPNQADAIAAAVEVGPDGTFLHGTTAATNTLLEGTGAKVGLVTDSGYEDLIEIARQDRPALYDSSVDRPSPLVARDNRVSDPSELRDVDVVAVALIDSYLDPSRERAIAAQLEIPHVLSSVVSPEFREYERLATTVLSAYLTPSVAGYLQRLDRRLEAGRKLVMTSSGGLMPFIEGAGAAGRLLLSGPAGGAVASAALGAHHGHDSIITFDMGGTSTDVSRISGGQVTISPGHRVGGRVNRVPSVPIETIGAGGGSIAWVDPGGALRVGPRSAGALPGPACYGKGGVEPTVTDANLLVGNLPGSLLLGGSLPLDEGAASDAVSRVGDRLGLDVLACADGILEVVDAHMERALRSVSVEEGVDPRDSVLVAFGGAGGLHASRLARRLGIGRTLIPPFSGVFSALGLLLATPRADAVKTVMIEPGGDLHREFREIESEATSRFEAMFGSSPASVEVSADVRYRGQSHELVVGGAAEWEILVRSFDEAHLERFGFARPGEPIEVVNVRASATGNSPLNWAGVGTTLPGSPPDTEGPVYDRSSLPVGYELAGRAVVVDDNSATLVEEDDVLVVLEDGTLQISPR